MPRLQFEPVFAFVLLGLDFSNPAVAAAAITAAVTILLAILRAVALWSTGKRDRQRELYSQAYKTAMAWREMLYRVRRRADGDEAERALIDRFHELQEEIDYYQGWTASESKWMGRSFCRLVAGIKEATRELIRLAWAEPKRRTAAESVREADGHPATDAARDTFLKDIRNHLSLFPVMKVFVFFRNLREPQSINHATPAARTPPSPATTESRENG